MRILLITPSDEGNNHSYTASLAKAFCELGHEVLHFSQNREKSDKMHRSIPAFANKFKYFSAVYSKFHKSVIKQWQIRREALVIWENLFGYIQILQKDSNRPDLLFFESLDATIGHYITRWDIDNKLTIPFSGILVCPEDTRVLTKSFLRRGPFDPYNILKSKKCRSIGILVEDSFTFLQQLIHKPVILLPDIVSISGSINENLLGKRIKNLAAGRFIIGTWGSLSLRKGITDFLQVIFKLPPEKYFFVMGGLINTEGLSIDDKNEIQQGATGKVENLLIIDKWLSDDELFSGMESCDLISAVYPCWKFSSGIIGHAAVVKTPILVNEGYVMGKRVTDFNIGFVRNKQTDIAEWISENMTKVKSLRNSVSFNEGCSRYCESFGYEQWERALTQLIEP